MKNFGTQCVTLMMIFVMVYAAPTSEPCKDKRRQLELIREAAKTVSKQNLTDLYVYKISESKTCPEKFFCLADKSLKKVMNGNSNPNKHLLQKLEQALNVYTKNETCDLHMTDLDNVKVFLHDIILCVRNALGNDSNICPK